MQVGLVLAYFGLYFLTFLYGITFGSLSTVLIYRIPLKEKFTLNRSYCRTCKSRLAWYDLVPLLSYLLLGGRCRKCKTKIPALYPSIEALNGIGYVLVFMINGFTLLSILYCLLFTILVVIAVIFWRTHEIPISLLICAVLLGAVGVIWNFGTY